MWILAVQQLIAVTGRLQWYNVLTTVRLPCWHISTPTAMLLYGDHCLKTIKLAVLSICVLVSVCVCVCVVCC